MYASMVCQVSLLMGFISTASAKSEIRVRESKLICKIQSLSTQQLMILNILFNQITGGGLNGCMGAVNKGARSKNGEIIGVIHEKWCVDGQEDNLISNMIVVGA
jgi:predicted Rossmann-fold nucleotide-binding protein